MNASRPFEHAPVKVENVKSFRWDRRLQKQKQKLFLAFNGAPHIWAEKHIFGHKILMKPSHAVATSQWVGGQMELY